MKPVNHLGSLQKFEGATGEFKGALGPRLQLILSPEGTSTAKFYSPPPFDAANAILSVL